MPLTSFSSGGRQRRTIRELSMLEGVPVSLLSTFNGNLAAGAINVNMGAHQLPANHAIFADALIVGTNVPIDFQIFRSMGSGAGGIQGTQADVMRASLGVNGSYREKIEALLTQSMTGANNAIAQMAIRRLRNADGTVATVANADAWITAALVGRLMYDDTNFGADKIIKFVGDSIFRAVGRTAKANCFDWKLRQFYADKGYNVRGVMKASSGSTSGNHETWRQAGWHDEEQVDLLVYFLGANDAAQGTGDVAYGNNLGAFITMKQKRWPSAKMLVLAPPPLQNAGYEAAAVLLRTKAAAVVAAANDPNVKLCNLGALGATFSGNNANYAATDGAGAGLHPSDAGDAYIWGGNVAAGGAFTGLQAFLTANLPSL